MEWQSGLILYAALLLVLLFSGLWIFVSLGIVALVALLIVDPNLLNAIDAVMWHTTDSFLLSAVPLFLFMGSFALRSGLSRGLYNSLSLWIGRVPGGLAHANIAECAVFSAVCGSSLATAGAVGAVAIPEMNSRGYDRTLTYGSLAAGGTLGILIPPSIAMILYAAMVGESVGRCFIAGVIPGILLAIAFSIHVMIRTLLNPSLAPREDKATWRARLVGLKDIVPFLILIGLVLGFIYFGVASPTETAGLACASVIVLAVIYRHFSFAAVKHSLLDTARTNASVIFLVVTAQTVSLAMVSAGIPRGMANAIGSMQLSPAAVFAAIVAMYFVLGCLIDSLSMMLLTLPVVHPIIAGLGFDLVWFAVVLVILMETGLITPPVGVNLFIIQGIAKEPDITKVAWGSLPYVLIMMAMVGVLWFFPSIALWLPSHM